MAGPRACLWTRQSITIVSMHFIDNCQAYIELGNQRRTRMHVVAASVLVCDVFVRQYVYYRFCFISNCANTDICRMQFTIINIYT